MLATLFGQGMTMKDALTYQIALLECNVEDRILK